MLLGAMCCSQTSNGAGNRHFCQSVERLRKGGTGVKKQLGCTWIEVNSEIKCILRTAEIVRADV